MTVRPEGQETTESMKQIHQNTYDAMQKTHPIEAAIWGGWIRTGEAQLVPSPTGQVR